MVFVCCTLKIWFRRFVMPYNHNQCARAHVDFLHQWMECCLYAASSVGWISLYRSIKCQIQSGHGCARWIHLQWERRRIEKIVKLRTFFFNIFDSLFVLTNGREIRLYQLCGYFDGACQVHDDIEKIGEITILVLFLVSFISRHDGNCEMGTNLLCHQGTKLEFSTFYRMGKCIQMRKNPEMSFYSNIFHSTVTDVNCQWL